MYLLGMSSGVKAAGGRTPMRLVNDGDAAIAPGIVLVYGQIVYPIRRRDSV